MIEKSCCFTGHRYLPIQKLDDIVHRLERELEKLIEAGYCFFNAGGALGFDTVAALTVLRLREKYPHIKLILVLPCQTQAKSWPEKDRIIYEDIKRHADKIIYTSKEYCRGCMHLRNRHLVDSSSACVCYLEKETGGTAYTVNYAAKKGIRVINLANC